jgi:Fe-S cluster assembly protein SufD
VLTLAQWANHNPTEAAEFLARYDGASAFEQLNGAFSDDGVVIDIAANVQLEQPIYIVHQWRLPTMLRSAASQMANPRIIVRAAAHSQCSVITHWVGDDTAESLTNSWLSVEVGPGAHVSHLNLQEESSRSFHVDTSRLQLAANAHFSKHDFALGAALGRSSTLVTLGGAGADVNLSGLFAPSGTQHLDTYVHIDHAAAHTTSRQDFRGIAAGRGRGVFNGKVVVRPGAQKIDARQSNRNLLLSTTAEIDSRPELEIYAHDVKCSHGATTGQLDPVSLFYLRSRGLSELEARALLIRAFAQSMLSTVQVGPVREWLEARVQQRFDLSAGGAP